MVNVKNKIKVTFAYKNVANIYIVYEINLSPFTQGSDLHKALVRKSLFGSVTLPVNADFDKYKYFCYGIGFDPRRKFSSSDGTEFSKNVIIFGVDMSRSAHVDNRNKI